MIINNGWLVSIHNIFKKINRFFSTYRWALTFLLLAATALMIYQQDRSFLAIVSLNPGLLAQAVWLLMIYNVLMSERFRILTQLFLGRAVLSIGAYLHSYLVSRVLNGVLPQFGNLYRGSELRKKAGLSWSQYLSISLAGVAIDIIAIILVAFLALFQFRFYDLGNAPLRLSNLTGFMNFTLAASILSILIGCFAIWKFRHTKFVYLHSTDAKLTQAFIKRILSLRHSPVLIVHSLASVGLLSIVLWIILTAMGFEPGINDAVILMMAARLGQYVIITPGNLGVRELVYASIGSQLSIGIGAAVTASIALRVLNWIVLGLLFVIPKVNLENSIKGD